MEINWDLISNFAIALLAIVNPVEKIPLWVQASQGGSRDFRWWLAGLIILSSACVLLVFLWFGHHLLIQLKVELASFKIGGGLILLQFGFSMLKGTAVELKENPIDESGDLKHRVLTRYQQIFIPIGVPVIAGPGAITTAIIYGYQSQSLLTDMLLSLTLVGVLAIVFVVLLLSPAIQKIVGNLSLDLVSRVFGMILIAISVQFMVEGLSDIFPGWVA
ncbi:MarC family protein [Desulfosarcina sp.]|uniref:MarC family protein n=1 Tax=Desulfosarcina sp. TaxID=2027861 RepID=UPI003970DF0E